MALNESGIDTTQDPFGVEEFEKDLEEERRKKKERQDVLDKLTPEQVAHYRENFDLFDQDGDGFITAKELSVMLRCTGQQVTLDEAQAMIDRVDDNKNGTVEFDEFLVLVGAGMHLNEGFSLRFEDFDKDGDGFISFEEIKTTFAELGEKLTDDEIRAMISEADVDNDGQVSYQEFVNMMLNIQN